VSIKDARERRICQGSQRIWIFGNHRCARSRVLDVARRVGPSGGAMRVRFLGRSSLPPGSIQCCSSPGPQLMATPRSVSYQIVLNQSTQDWYSGPLRKAGRIETSAIHVYQCHVVRFSLPALASSAPTGTSNTSAILRIVGSSGGVHRACSMLERWPAANPTCSASALSPIRLACRRSHTYSPKRRCGTANRGRCGRGITDPYEEI
jgi:hypothetical protein